MPGFDDFLCLTTVYHRVHLHIKDCAFTLERSGTEKSFIFILL